MFSLRASGISDLRNAQGTKTLSRRRVVTVRAAANPSKQSSLKHTVDDASKLKDHNDAVAAEYLPTDVQRDDAHVYKDADGYYVVKEEWRKPTNPFERLKLASDPMKTVVNLNSLKEYSEKSGRTQEEFKAWEESIGDDAEVDQRFKWAGLFHRRKGHYGRYMMRLKLPGGVISSEQMRYLAEVVQNCGDDGCADITTRQNIQMRGIQLADSVDILERLQQLGMCSLQSGLDNVRNATGNPIAGIDPLEIVDTRPYTDAIQAYVTGGGKGNAAIANLGRKWNVCVVGSSDYFEHPDINDLAFIPAEKDGVFGFNVWVGGFISSARAAEAIPLDAWVPGGDVVAMTHAVLTTFRDYGHRGNRQKARMMWLVEEMGLETFREEVASRMPAESVAREAAQDLVDHAQPRRNIVGVHPQKQPGLSWVGINVPGGRMQGSEMAALADFADRYGSGELRLTVEQNVLIPDVPTEQVDALLAEDLLTESFLSVAPGRLVSNMVACTGSQFCGFAQIETKKNAFELAEHLESVLDIPEDVRILWTGCPNSCVPVQVGDIGIMGAQAKNPNGKGMVPAANVFVGGTVGPGGHLKEDPEIKKVPLTELAPVIEELMVERFKATRRATPAPNRFKAAQWKINKSATYTSGKPKALGKATHICTQCGYIYQEEKPFESTADDFACPSCSAPKAKFEKMEEDAPPPSARPSTTYPEGTLVALDPAADVALTLVKKESISENTRKFTFALPSPEHVLGLPVGQHVEVKFGDTARPYTPVTGDATRGTVDLVVKVYPDGNVSGKLDAVEVGEAVTFSGPKGLTTYTARGEFTTGVGATLRRAKHVAMVCGGTGITPMLQVIRQIFADPGDTTKVSLLFANQTPEDILLKQELDELAAKDPNFKVTYTVDKAGLLSFWKGEKGFVDAPMLSRTLPPPSDDVTVLVCGPPAMRERAVTPALKQLGFGDDAIIYF